MRILVNASFKPSAKLESIEKALWQEKAPYATGYNGITSVRTLQWVCASKFVAKRLIMQIMKHEPCGLTFEVQ